MQYFSQDVPNRKSGKSSSKTEKTEEKDEKEDPEENSAVKAILTQIFNAAKVGNLHEFKKYCSDKYKINDETFKNFIIPASKSFKFEGSSTNVTDENYYVIHGTYNRSEKESEADVSFHFYKYADGWELVDVTPDYMPKDPSKYKAK